MHEIRSIELTGARGTLIPAPNWRAPDERRSRGTPPPHHAGAFSRDASVPDWTINSIAAAYVGASAAAAEVRARLLAIAPSEASVLILGDSGTGKELAAHILHEASPRHARPFVAVDCGALSESLAESELFGHIRGAFTGAVATRSGLFAEADGGTLLLDEIGSASPAIQARLIRVLESREVRQVGNNRSRAVNVRVIAATNRDLRTEVDAGRFREDLLYRLDVIRIRLPALRDRREDIPLLAEHLLGEISSRTGRGYEINDAAMDALVALDWPGNVRELRNALKHAAALCQGGPIATEHLPERTVTPAGEGTPLSWERWLAVHERAFLLAKLEANGWNRTRTARQLGMSRQSLYDRINRYGLWPTVGLHARDPGEGASCARQDRAVPSG